MTIWSWMAEGGEVDVSSTEATGRICFWGTRAGGVDRPQPRTSCLRGRTQDHVQATLKAVSAILGDPAPGGRNRPGTQAAGCGRSSSSPSIFAKWRESLGSHWGVNASAATNSSSYSACSSSAYNRLVLRFLGERIPSTARNPSSRIVPP